MVAGTTTYSYDGNGNLKSNTNTVTTTQNKSYTYNLLNLPLVVTIPTGTVTYTYDASGQKLRKVTVISGVTKTTDYISGIEYDNSTTTIGFIQTEEGKAAPISGGYDYNYYLSDNLGNTRVTFDTKTGTAVSQQQDDYYPFGLELPSLVTFPKNEYLYNKKELQEELGVYDYGARFYDPVIARWTTIDPHSERYRRWSPYNYGDDNPITFIDPDGMDIITPEKYQKQLSDLLTQSFGKDASGFSFDKTGKLSFGGDVSKFSKAEQSAFKELNNLMSFSTKYNVVIEEKFCIVKKDGASLEINTGNDGTKGDAAVYPSGTQNGEGYIGINPNSTKANVIDVKYGDDGKQLPASFNDMFQNAGKGPLRTFTPYENFWHAVGHEMLVDQII